MAPSKNRSDKAAELHQQLETEIAELVTSDQWARMLETASKFHSYSLGNVMLILSQRPTATRVAGYRTWQSVGRQVRNGESGIAILAPCAFRRRVVDEATGDETEVRGIAGFRVVHVFDIAQTEGEALVELRPELLEGEAPAGLWDGLAAQVEAAGFQLERGDCGGANGVTRYDVRTVTVRADVDDAQACKTLAHELAHVLLHEQELGGCRGRIEVEAESVAYVVAQACGLPTAAYSLPYVASWAGGDVKVVKATAERVIRTAHAILDALEPATELAEAVAA